MPTGLAVNPAESVRREGADFTGAEVFSDGLVKLLAATALRNG